MGSRGKSILCNVSSYMQIFQRNFKNPCLFHACLNLSNVSFSHKRALPSSYAFKYAGHSLNPSLDASLLSVLKALDHVRQQNKVGNTFTFLFSKNHTYIYLYLP